MTGNDYARDTWAALQHLAAVLIGKGVELPPFPADEELREFVGRLNDSELQDLINSCLDFHNRVATTGWGRKMALMLIEHARYHRGRLAAEESMRKKSAPKTGRTKKTSDETIKKIQDMASAGYDQNDIAKTLGLHRNTVGKYLNGD